jgi:hypothetical protein
MVRVDKTLSELWDLKNNPSDFTIDQLKEVAAMAINALHKQEIEHENFVDASYKAIKKQEDNVKRYKEALKYIVNIDGWFIGKDLDFDNEMALDLIDKTARESLED